MSDGESYRPSNGSEGADFINHWCGRCKRDADFQLTQGESDGCPIVAATFRYKVDSPLYPKEWVYDNLTPVCTAFDDIADRLTRQERAAQVSLPI